MAGAELFSGVSEPMTVSRAEQTVIPHFDESVREHMLKKPANELLGGQRTGSDLIGGRVLVLERHLAILQAENPVVADGHAKDVGRQVSEGVLTRADRLTVNHPVLLPDALSDQIKKVGLFQVVSDLGAKRHRQGFDGNQEVGAGADPSAKGICRLTPI